MEESNMQILHKLMKKEMTEASCQIIYYDSPCGKLVLAAVGIEAKKLLLDIENNWQPPKNLC